MGKTHKSFLVLDIGYENHVFATFCKVICNIRVPCSEQHKSNFIASIHAKDCCYEIATTAIAIELHCSSTF